MIGLTTWTMHQIADHTFPQLMDVVVARGGTIRYVRDEALLRYHFGKIGEEGRRELARVWDAMQTPGYREPAETAEGREATKAYRAFVRHYNLRWPEKAKRSSAERLPISREAARGLEAWWTKGRCPSHVYRLQIAPFLDRILATADADA